MASQTFNSSTTWTAPTGVTSVTVVCIGNGGNGSDGGGGGGGGAYAKKNSIAVTPGNSYTVTVDGGAPEWGLAKFVGDAGATCAAAAGRAGSGSSYGAGGVITSPTVGDVKYAGGRGGNGSLSGGGGGEAGCSNKTGGVGGAGGSTTGGAGGSSGDGADGGRGNDYPSGTGGTAGSAPGGGGGGGTNGISPAHGRAIGQVILTWTDPFTGTAAVTAAKASVALSGTILNPITGTAAVTAAQPSVASSGTFIPLVTGAAAVTAAASAADLDGVIQTITSPAPSSTLAGSTVTFAWECPSGVTEVELWIGNTPGAVDVAYSGSGLGAATSHEFTTLPVDGRTLYATLYFYSGGAWRYVIHAFTAAAIFTGTIAVTAAAPTVEASGTAESSFGAVVAAAPTVAISGTVINPITGTAAVTAAQPTAEISGAYTPPLKTGEVAVAAGGPTVAASGAVNFHMISPAPGSTLTDVLTTFTWTPIPGALQYSLWFGTAPGAFDLGCPLVDAALSSYEADLPLLGETVYVRLWAQYVVAGWQYVDYVYTEADLVPHLTSPTPGSTLEGDSVELSWTPGSGVTAYGVYVGSTPGGSYDLGIYWPGLNTSQIVTNPRMGATVYVRLWAEISGQWRFREYAYTADTITGTVEVTAAGAGVAVDGTYTPPLKTGTAAVAGKRPVVALVGEVGRITGIAAVTGAQAVVEIYGDLIVLPPPSSSGVRVGTWFRPAASGVRIGAWYRPAI